MTGLVRWATPFLGLSLVIYIGDGRESLPRGLTITSGLLANNSANIERGATYSTRYVKC